MATRDRVRTREPEPSPSLYEHFLRHFADMRTQQNQGRLLCRQEDRDWDSTRQGLMKYYLHPQLIGDTAIQDWQCFVHKIIRHSGKHKHQGGLVIYVLEGRGYSVVDGERHDWEAGDLLLLPIKEGGVEHQHFNLDAEKPCRWLAFIHWPTLDALASPAEQLEDSPTWGGQP
jgi:hypothetical protein